MYPLFLPSVRVYRTELLNSRFHFYVSPKACLGIKVLVGAVGLEPTNFQDQSLVFFQLNYAPTISGAEYRNRTDDLMLTRQLLYTLS